MYFKNYIFPQANIYSSKTLFENLENRNQKRKAQIMKRKMFLTSKNKIINLNVTIKDKSSEQMITQSTQETITNVNNNIYDLSKSGIRQDHFCNKVLCTTKSKTIERFLSSFKNYNNNADSLYIGQNFNISNECLGEKEVNISNLNDNENYLEVYNTNGKDDKPKSQNKIINFNDKLTNNYNLKGINKIENMNQKKKIFQGNKYAIEFLSSSLDSFIELKNKLVTKVKYDKNYFTLSYSQALFSDFNNLEKKKFGEDKINDYEVNDIIKEENESCSPNDKYSLEQSIMMISPKNNNNKITRKCNNKMPNKSFSKIVENNYMRHNNISMKKYSFNQNSLKNNNNKLGIRKYELSLEMKNKRKTYENKEYQNLLDVNNKKQKNIKNKILSPKLSKIKIYKQTQKKENYKSSNKEKMKKIRKM